MILLAINRCKEVNTFFSLSRTIILSVYSSSRLRRYTTAADSDEEYFREASEDSLVELPGDRNDDMQLLRIEPSTEVTYRSRVNQLWTKIVGALPEKKHNSVDIIKSWESGGHKVERKDLTVLITRLRRRERYLQALQISDWMAREKPCNAGIRDELTRLYLTSRCGLFEVAEHMLASLDIGLQKEMTYTFLLSGYTSKGEVKRAESLWRRMKERGFIKTPHGYNNMLIMYRREKLHGEFRRLYVEMLLSRVRPDATTFLTVLQVREDVGGFDGIEKKATPAMESLEIMNLHGCVMEVMMRVYGYLGDLEGVERLWQRLTTRASSLHNTTYLCAIEAFGLAGGIDRCEEVFKAMKAENQWLDRQAHHAMIDVYYRAGMAEKAEQVLTSLLNKGRSCPGLAINLVIKTFVKQNQVERAVSLLDLALGRTVSKHAILLAPSVISIMDAYARTGDISAAEQIVSKCKEKDFFKEAKLYNALLKVYLNAPVSLDRVENRFQAHSVNFELNEETRELLMQLAKGGG